MCYQSCFMDGKNLRPREVRQFIPSSVATKSCLSELGPRSLDSKGYFLRFHPSTKGFMFVDRMWLHTVKGFGIVNNAEIDVFLELSCFFDDPVDVDNLMRKQTIKKRQKC